MQCIYRKPKTLELCGKKIDECSYCRHHMKVRNVLYEVINDVIGNKNIFEECDMYTLYKHIYDNINFTNISEDNEAKRLFVIEILKQLNKEKLLKMYGQYYSITKATNASCKTAIIKKLCALNENTYKLASVSDNIRKISLIQSWYRNKLYRIFFIRLDEDHQPINKDDIFTYDNINEIPAERLFMYYDDKKNLYAFDAVELEYFVRHCVQDSLTVCNPYTKEVIPPDVIAKLYKFVDYNKLTKKNVNNECIWITDLQAYTDLSIEIERQGFYNSPDWFAKFGRRQLMNVIKLFKDFSLMVQESRAYFQRFDGDVFEFCKEGIKLFRECNADKYILCCNFMKALAMMSSDFYYNLPDWLLQTFTNSHIMARHRNNNFLLYYYVEYLE